MKTETALIINQIIASLHEEGDLSKRLDRFYHELYDLVYYDRVSIMFYREGRDGYDKQFSMALNWEDISGTMEEYKEYFINVDDTMPILSQDKPIVFRSSQMFDNEERSHTEYYQGWQVPSGCINSIEANIDLKSKTGLKANLYLFRDSGKADFSDEDETIIRMFQPHLSRVLRRFGEAPAGYNPASSLNSRMMAIITVDSHLNILDHNNTYLQLRRPYGAKLDEEIVDACFAMKKQYISKGEPIYEARLEGMPYYVEITKKEYPSEEDEHIFICLLYDISRAYDMSVASVKVQCGLSERESAVFMFLLDGLNTKEIAMRLFISIPAVKKYCSSIYSKMGINGRNEIINALKLRVKT